MRLFILVASLFVYCVVAQSVVAQCADYAGCVGQVAEGGARLREFQRATAAVVATDRAIARVATSEAQRMNATATELARPTRTPQPSATSLPTQTPVPSVTPQPFATSQITQPVVQVITVMATVKAQPAQPEQPTNWLRIIATALGVPILVAALWWWIARIRKIF